MSKTDTDTLWFDPIVAEVIEKYYGAGTAYAEPNEYGETGLTLALARGDVDAEDVVIMLETAIMQGWRVTMDEIDEMDAYASGVADAVD